MSFGGGLHNMINVCSNVSDEPIASSFRATIIILTAIETLKFVTNGSGSNDRIIN
jgi:hypothetical protein